MLTEIDVFSGLTSGHLELLVDNLIPSVVKKDELVFEQDDEGEAFYIITEGTADVIRYEGNATILLASLVAGAYFGERALIKNQTRYASIKATSPTLHMNMVTRQGFETALGAPLRAFVPDKYTLDVGELNRAVRAIALFAPLSDDQIEDLVDAMKRRSFEPHEWVFEQGDVGDDFFVIVDGGA